MNYCERKDSKSQLLKRCRSKKLKNIGNISFRKFWVKLFSEKIYFYIEIDYNNEEQQEKEQTMKESKHNRIMEYIKEKNEEKALVQYLEKCKNSSCNISIKFVEYLLKEVKIDVDYCDEFDKKNALSIVNY
jgi:hypothetical protein